MMGFFKAVPLNLGTLDLNGDIVPRDDNDSSTWRWRVDTDMLNDPNHPSGIVLMNATELMEAIELLDIADVGDIRHPNFSIEVF